MMMMTVAVIVIVNDNDNNIYVAKSKNGAPQFLSFCLLNHLYNQRKCE